MRVDGEDLFGGEWGEIEVGDVGGEGLVILKIGVMIVLVCIFMGG